MFVEQVLAIIHYPHGDDTKLFSSYFEAVEELEWIDYPYELYQLKRIED